MQVVLELVFNLDHCQLNILTFLKGTRMIKLDNSVRFIVIQFRSSNTRFIPDYIPEREAEFGRKKQEPKTKGKIVIKPTENCCLLNLASDLEESEYELVDAFFQGRQGENDRIFYITRFTFIHYEYVESSIRLVQEEMNKGLREVCNEALWKTQVFLNPFCKNGEETSEQNSVSINSVARQPLFDRGGNRLKVWQRDSGGERMGKEPVEIKPEHMFEIREGAISVFP